MCLTGTALCSNPEPLCPSWIGIEDEEREMWSLGKWDSCSPSPASLSLFPAPSCRTGITGNCWDLHGAIPDLPQSCTPEVGDTPSWGLGLLCSKLGKSGGKIPKGGKDPEGISVHGKCLKSSNQPRPHSEPASAGFFWELLSLGAGNPCCRMGGNPEIGECQQGGSRTWKIVDKLKNSPF